MRDVNQEGAFTSICHYLSYPREFKYNIKIYIRYDPNTRQMITP